MSGDLGVYSFLPWLRQGLAGAITAADNSANYECQLSGAAVREVILTPDGKWISPKGGL